MTTSSTSIPQPTIPFRQIGAILIGGVILFLVICLSVLGGSQLWYLDRILPGVSIAGVNLSGLTKDQAALELNNRLNFPFSGRIMFIDGERFWVATPFELGLVLNLDGSVNTAYQYGRSGGIYTSFSDQISSWRRGINIAPEMILDQRVASNYLQKIALEIDRPPVEGNLAINGIEVTETYGQVGRMVNIDATLSLLTSQLQKFQDGEVQLVIEEKIPSIIDVKEEADLLRKILSAPVVLSLPDAKPTDPGPWTIDQETLAQIIQIGRKSTGEKIGLSIGLNDLALDSILANFEDVVQLKSQNSRFIFNDDSRQLELIQPAIIGRTLNKDLTKASILQSILLGNHDINLDVNLDLPLVGDNAQAQELGITELVSTAATYFRGSSDERIQNIQAASSRFHGILIAPGETFSMGEALGDVSLENGYAEAMIIYNNRTIKGVGGGVCQVSTTLFRTVFLGGFPVVERHPHAYRVGYYEQTYSGRDSNLAGLDATVYVPLVDFKFTNDTPNWLLMEVYVNVVDRRLTWKFYSTSDGRKVYWETSGLQNVIPAPEPLLQVNPDLGIFEMKQVDWSADGATITINRNVMKGDQIYFSDKFYTAYSPWQAICEYGIGVEDPITRAAEKGLCQP